MNDATQNAAGNGKMEKTRYIETGINGRGEKVWHVITDWTQKDGRARSFRETFDTESEAKHWMEWC